MSNVAQLQPKKKSVSDPDVSSEVKLVTLAMAKRFLDLGEYDLQRVVATAHVEELTSEMNAERFEAGTAIWIAHITDTDRFVLVNGRHTCTAIIASGKPQTLTIITTRIKSIEEAGRIYSRLDINKMRRPFDRIKALKIPAVVGLNVAETNGLIAAIKLLLANFENMPGTKATNVDRSIYKSAERWAEAIEEWKKPIKLYFDALEYCDSALHRRRFLRSSTMAVALATLRDQPKKAWEFWASAAADDELRARSPGRKLNNWLIANKGGPTSVAVRQARYVAACWNAYYDGREIYNVVPSDAGAMGLTLKGTKYKAKRR